MRGKLTFSVLPNQEIECKAELYEVSEFDLLRFATALTEQAFKLQMSLIAKKVEAAKAKQVIQSAEEFKRKVDNNSH